MSWQFKCHECGTPLGFDGLCWKCRARHHREEVENWTVTEIDEKVQQIIKRLKDSSDDKFYSSDECEYFYDLMTKGIYRKEFSETALEKEIYYPSALYYKADNSVRDKLIDRIMSTDDSGEGSELLGCLAMIGDKKSQDALYELKIHPKPWRKKLYVDSDIYAEEGGWTFDCNNNHIKLNYDKCFSFDAGEKKDENGTFIGRKRGERCQYCGCELIDILVIDGRDDRFSFLGLNGIITASCCPNCVGMKDDISCKFTLDGTSEILPFEGTDENYLDEGLINEMVNNKFIVSMQERPLFYGTFGNDISTIGGFANWVQDWEYKECPECGKKMKYLAQIHWDTIMDGMEGTLFIEICPECKVITMFHQQT